MSILSWLLGSKKEEPKPGMFEGGDRTAIENRHMVGRGAFDLGARPADTVGDWWVPSAGSSTGRDGVGRDSWGNPLNTDGLTGGDSDSGSGGHDFWGNPL